MELSISSENFVLVGAMLLFVAVMAGKVAYRFGAPALLLFLGVGMIFGWDLISFRSVDMTQFIGMIALCVILFTGGMDTKYAHIRPVIGPGVVLATVGVVLTALIMALFVWAVAPWLGIEMPFVLALLLAATMSSTDSASVFSILRSKKQGLRQHLRPLLELESGSNDPMAYMLTVLLIGILSHSDDTAGGWGMDVLFFGVQTVFFDGFTWLMQIIMFLTLGLFVNTNELFEPEVLILGVAVGIFMIVVARPVSVFACLLPFRRFSFKARAYVSWVGLRGAVPILFAIYPMVAHIEQSGLLFNVVFLSTIISLAVQGTTVSGMANLLGLAYEQREATFNVNLSEDVKSALTEVEVNEAMMQSGRTLQELTLPENTLVMMVCRDGAYFVPKGKTELRLGDKLLVISDRSEELAASYKNMGIDEILPL